MSIHWSRSTKSPYPPEKDENKDEEAETFRLSNGEFTEGDLEVIESNLGELAPLSPEKRKRGSSGTSSV